MRWKAGRFMKQPCIKFITFILTYLFFLGILLATSLYTTGEKIERVKFSEGYSSYLANFTHYTGNEHLKYRFIAEDFYIRVNKPFTIDLIACIWFFGKKNKQTISFI